MHEIHGNPMAMTKAEQYESLLPQLAALIEHETDWIANFANTAAALRQVFAFFWVGFYVARGQELVLGPFQGTVACTRIAWGKGVCGAAAQHLTTFVVPDVEQFEGHIACSSLSKSEIVVPAVADRQCLWVLDIDSTELNTFDNTDAHYLEQIVTLLVDKHGTYLPTSLST